MVIFTLKLVMEVVFEDQILFESCLGMFLQVFWVWIETVQDSQSNVARVVAHQLTNKKIVSQNVRQQLDELVAT